MRTPLTQTTKLIRLATSFFLDLSYMFSRIVQSNKPHHGQDVNAHEPISMSESERQPLLTGNRSSESEVKHYLAM